MGFSSFGLSIISEPPVKGYISSLVKNVDEGVNYLTSIYLDNRGTILHPANFLIAFIWEDNKKLIAEMNRYFGIKNWGDNPERKTAVFEDGTFQHSPKSDSCAHSDRILGREMDLMFETNGLEKFIRTVPDLPQYVNPPLYRIYELSELSENI